LATRIGSKVCSRLHWVAVRIRSVWVWHWALSWDAGWQQRTFFRMKKLLRPWVRCRIADVYCKRWYQRILPMYS
jgi:hypothetical protein